MRKPNGYPNYAAEMIAAGEEPMPPEVFENSILSDLAWAKKNHEGPGAYLSRQAAQGALDAERERRRQEPVWMDIAGHELTLPRWQIDEIETAWGNWQGDDEAGEAERVLNVLHQFGLIKFPDE